jgi:peptidoglycan-N-acetylglucosamine deacetylase
MAFFVSGVARLVTAAFASLLIASAAFAEKRIALSFDDVPRHQGAFFSLDERTDLLIAALKKAKVKQAAFFLNPGKLGEQQGIGGEVRISAYTKAGHVIANHSANHINLGDATAEQYLADIDKAAAWLKGRKGYRPWFRFPYLHEGREDKVKRDAVRAGLDVRGLRNGYVTVDAADWHLDNLANSAKTEGRRMDMDALRSLFVQSHLEAANFNETLAIKTLGRAPAHVMLLHETDIGAMFIGELVAALRADGWTIITADEAYRDPIGKERPDVPSAQGTLTEALAWQAKLPAPRWPKATNTLDTDVAFQDKVLGTLRRQGGMCAGKRIWIPLEDSDRMFRQRGVDVSILGIRKSDGKNIFVTSNGNPFEADDKFHKQYLQYPVVLEKDGQQIRRTGEQDYALDFRVRGSLNTITYTHVYTTSIGGEYFQNNEIALAMLNKMRFGEAAAAICQDDK